MLLTIIIPYYNTLEYTKRLFEVLTPQLDDDIEVIIVDDGCNEKELDNLKATVIHLPTNSGNASRPRNVGLDNAKGKYIAFIDSDDMISNDYIEQIRTKLRKNRDIVFLSWEHQNGIILITSKPPGWNCAVWCRVYKRKIIGNTRFDESLKKAEDWKFNQNIKYNTSTCIMKSVYYYNSGREGSLTNG